MPMLQKRKHIQNPLSVSHQLQSEYGLKIFNLNDNRKIVQVKVTSRADVGQIITNCVLSFQYHKKRCGLIS